MSPTELIRARTGRIEAATAVALYGVYELVRGFGGEDWAAARLHTADIVGVERSLGIFWERGIQAASTSVPGLASVLGVLYMPRRWKHQAAHGRQAARADVSPAKCSRPPSGRSTPGGR